MQCDGARELRNKSQHVRFSCDEQARYIVSDAGGEVEVHACHAHLSNAVRSVIEDTATKEVRVQVQA